MRNFKWIDIKTEGEDPGKLFNTCTCTVIHPDRGSKKSFSLFESPDDYKYKQFSKIDYEGVYFFGGQRPDGQPVNNLHVLKVG